MSTDERPHDPQHRPRIGLADGFSAGALRCYRGLVRLLPDAVKQRALISLPVAVAGRRFMVPLLEGIEVPGVGLNWKNRLIQDLVRGRAGAFVDIGANLGQTLLDLRISDSQRAYVGFEPNPTCVHYVQRLVALNGWTESVTIVAAGVSDTCGVARLFMAAGQRTDEAATIDGALRSSARSVRSVAVPLVHLDAVWESLSPEPAAFVKIDVEGYEATVLRGAQELIRRDRPPILCEVLPAARGTSLEACRQRHQEIMKTIVACGYVILHLVKSTEHQVSGVNLLSEFPLQYWSPEKAHDHDYLLVASEDADRVAALLSPTGAQK